MRKKYLFILFAVTISILIYILFQLTRLKGYNHNDNTIKQIPSSAAIIIKAKSINYLQQQVNEEINFKNELLESTILRQAFSPLDIIDSLNQLENFSLENLKNYPIYISLHGQGKSSVETLYLIELQTKKETNSTISFIETGLPAKYTINQKKYNSSRIYSIKNNKTNKVISACINNGILLVSKSSLLIESSLRQMNTSTSWTNSTSFQSVKKTVGTGANCNIFINFSTLPDILLPITDTRTKKQLEKLKDQSEWGEIDLEIKNNGLQLNGFITENNHGVFSNIIKGTKGNKRHILQYLPSQINAYIAITFSNGNELNNKISSFYQHSNKLDPIISYEKRNKVELKKRFFHLLSGEAAVTYEGGNKSGNGILVLSLNSQSEAEKTIKELLDNTNNSSKPSTVYKPDDGLHYNIYKGFKEPVFEMLFGSLFGKTPNKYFTFYKNNIIVADNYKQLEQFLYNNILNKTLKYNKNHQQFLDNFSSRDNIFVFAKTEDLPQTTNNFFSPLWKNISQEQKSALSNFYAIGCQFSGTGNMIYSSIYLQYLPEKTSDPHTIWQSLLDSTAITKPTLVKNHYTNEKEVIIQDAGYNVYLMSNNGRMLWKKPLAEPILGEVAQIDYYKNNKLQYIFNTPTRIYILDRNGNNVANYPVRLPSKATNGLTVVDYDSNRNYRFFIACENRKIYLYNTKGNIIPGWQFKGSEGLISLPVQHFRTNNKDYIVVSDNRRNYILDRRGNIRVPIKTDFIASRNSPFYLINKDQPNDQLVTSSDKGEIIKISLKTGEVTNYSIGEVNRQHKLTVYFQNGKEQYLIAEPNKLCLKDKQLKTIFEKKFDSEINLNVDLYQFSSQITKVGISELTGNKIYLLNEDGTNYKGFPLIGKSRFSIGFLKSSSIKFNLIVSGANNYLYNYRVE
nr:DUF3352 domain-containing protein [uncultured Carboxylicivirga sp.]